MVVDQSQVDTVRGIREDHISQNYNALGASSDEKKGPGTEPEFEALEAHELQFDGILVAPV